MLSVPATEKSSYRTREGPARPSGRSSTKVALKASKLKGGSFTGTDGYFADVVLRMHLIFAQSG